jgi:hypothetical protein
MDMRLTRLGAGEFLKVRDGRGQRLEVLDGSVWVTQDGDPRDAFIGKGGSFVFDRSGLALVEALAESRMVVFGETVTDGAAREPAFA